MRLDADEIQAIAAALAGPVADELERRLCDSPAWAKSVPEIAAYLDVRESVVRDAIEDGRLPAIRVGRQIRVKRSDLFRLRGRPNA